MKGGRESRRRPIAGKESPAPAAHGVQRASRTYFHTPCLRSPPPSLLQAFLMRREGSQSLILRNAISAQVPIILHRGAAGREGGGEGGREGGKVGGREEGACRWLA
jgi:hypothetical protein